MPTVAQNVTPNTNQENVSPSVSLENVRKAACNAMAEHIDGTAKESRKRDRRERFSDAEKVELVFSSIDRAKAALAHPAVVTPTRLTRAPRPLPVIDASLRYSRPARPWARSAR